MATGRRRGRPRQFEPAEALEAALETFRRHGYSGTSLSDLTEATGLNRPSLYAAFGNKQALFEAAVDHYWAGVTARCGAALNGGGALAEDLRAFLACLTDIFTAEDPGGCVVVCGLPAEVERIPELREKLAGILAGADRALRGRLARAQREGELGPEVDPELIGSLIVNSTMAMSLRSRAGATREELDRQAEGLVRLVGAAG